MCAAYLNDTTFQMHSYLFLSSPPAHLRMRQVYDIKLAPQNGIVTTFDRSHQPRPTAWLSASKIETGLGFFTRPRPFAAGHEGRLSTHFCRWR